MTIKLSRLKIAQLQSEKKRTLVIMLTKIFKSNKFSSPKRKKCVIFEDHIKNFEKNNHTKRGKNYEIESIENWKNEKQKPSKV